MRWNMVFGALVVSIGLCSQSFGLELLDRMLGLNSYGCGSEPACCEPACGCDAEPACGCDTQPACGCDSCESSCCDAAPCCKKRCGGHGLLDGLFGHLGHKGCGSCSSCEPACGCDAQPACGCDSCSCDATPCCNKRGHRHFGLLDGLFRHGGHGHGCGCSSCGGCDSCGAPAASAPADSGDAAPMPPAPMADPSASLRSRRRVAHARSFASR